ncbi:sensor N-terminal transmembrane domain-containing protein [Roseovarius sp. SYSU LYC5161]|jgi:two-component system sensor histidine kinase ChvG|uniref:sensor N-terminal transmembrane domain-containing protein n=1 Tax=Roseovarius halophilus (ex Wu et al. 2025) TaxID=3376060 RepID=UPI0028727C5A|nr:sensor histidine kinase [Roseovarius sp.]
MALAERIDVRDMASHRDDDVVLGDDFVAPDNIVEDELRARRERRGVFSLRESSLTRKIITFNLIALNVLVAGILYLNSSRDNLALQRADSLVGEVELVADLFEAMMPAGAPVSLATGDGISPGATLERVSLRDGVEAFILDTQGTVVARTVGTEVRPAASITPRSTVITDALNSVWNWISAPFATVMSGSPPPPVEERLKELAREALTDGTQVRTQTLEGGTVLSVATPLDRDGNPVGVAALVSPSGEIDMLVRYERERVLRMFIIATLVSIGLSLILASTIANPLSDLASAAEIGRARSGNRGSGGRIRIPDLTARPDEIGRLSGALRGMVGALYHRIDSNEQFAADVAHEIKNPLASLRSAVGTMRVAKRADQREKLLEVIEHDVRRLDRLVSDISNASRLDSELVKEEQEPFDLLEMLRNLTAYLGEEAKKRDVEFITDFPANPIIITGLEARLAQVFVNLITNAISFCEEGDAIRVWARKRENRVLVVVEDTGPGIPEQSLTKIFQRFYSQRDEGEFGNNSGLGLSISKQIVEAHDGVIWAENIRPTDADITSDPLGARFVVGLPV